MFDKHFDSITKKTREAKESRSNLDTIFEDQRKKESSNELRIPNKFSSSKDQTI